ncbi:MAG: hypothetical protein R2766_02625 [Saprospiraceae bacterium]
MKPRIVDPSKFYPSQERLWHYKSNHQTHWSLFTSTIGTITIVNDDLNIFYTVLIRILYTIGIDSSSIN